ncbi:hypothetical protein [Bradyrhizobium sp. NBAIM01]|uniref:hypothetical protein n=1 Tax=Bradyrhizobium sp. NBAIM01 TaxID=2793818 RepID=UPI001CD73AEB|nr:hypothetical protein [Bradyrhizobium sp. NBAIM01]MCA1510325.1 hypothetical protein [Bradyrhizobium sp. NBAIM01]
MSVVLIEVAFTDGIKGEIFDQACPPLPDHPGQLDATATLSTNCPVTVLLRPLEASADFRGGAIQQRAGWRRHQSHQRRL